MSKPFYSEACEWGRTMEDVAIHTYENQTNLIVTRCGLITILNSRVLVTVYNPGQKICPKLRKTALYLIPQAMYNQFKRQSAGSVSELYYIYRKT